VAELDAGKGQQQIAFALRSKGVLHDFLWQWR
jgi:hypothetical protein